MTIISLFRTSSLCLGHPPLFFWVVMGQNSIDSPSTAHWSRVSARRPSSSTSRLEEGCYRNRPAEVKEYMCDSSGVSLRRLAHWKIWTLILASTFTHTDRWVAKVFWVAVRVNPISLSYPFPFVLPLALVPWNRVVSARGENIPLWNETPLGYGYVIIHRR